MCYFAFRDYRALLLEDLFCIEIIFSPLAVSVTHTLQNCKPLPVYIQPISSRAPNLGIGISVFFGSTEYRIPKCFRYWYRNIPKFGPFPPPSIEMGKSYFTAGKRKTQAKLDAHDLSTGYNYKPVVSFHFCLVHLTFHLTSGFSCYICQWHVSSGNLQLGWSLVSCIIKMDSDGSVEDVTSPSSSVPSRKVSKYEDVIRHSANKDSVWHYFLREVNGSTAQCKDAQCLTIIKTSAGSTSGLHTHLKSKHGIVLLKKHSKSLDSASEG